MNKQKKVIAITGGSSGLGLELVKLYAEENKVYILDKNTPPITGRNIHFIPVDLSKKIPAKIITLLPIIDVCICNVGISLSGNFTALEWENKEKIFTINTLSHIQLVKKILKINT